MTNESSSTLSASSASPARMRAPVTDRVNVEPAIIRGMTSTEAKVIAIVVVPAFLLLGGILVMLTGYWQIVLLLGIVGPLVTLWYASAYLQKEKRGRPDGYYTQAIHFWMTKRGFAKNHFINHNGQWDLGRSLELNLTHPYELTKAAKSPSLLQALFRRNKS